MTSAFHIAQVNIAKIRAALNDPLMTGFVARLDDINAMADHSPGFVWRLQSSSGDAASIRVYDDVMILVNLSVWEDLEALHHFFYKTQHAEVLKQRKFWFERMETMNYALWWVARGHAPTPQEARERLEHLHEYGETPNAFTFAQLFPMSA